MSTGDSYYLECIAQINKQCLLEVFVIYAIALMNGKKIEI